MSESDLVRRLRETANAEECDGRQTLAAEIREAIAALEAAERELELAQHTIDSSREESLESMATSIDGRMVTWREVYEGWKRAEAAESRAALAQRATEGK